MNILWILFICMILFPVGTYFIQKRNLNYYKVHGREGLEIETWLKTRKWYPEFYTNIQQYLLESFRQNDGSIAVDSEASKYIEEETERIISGHYNKQTISAAFSWRTSNEGTRYWGKREYEFLRWYFGQYIDLHLFK